MKFLILPLLLISANALACANKIDESKVMLFVDTNFSDLEVETAKKAACQRGEKLMVVPRNYKEYSAPIRNMEAVLKKLKSCKQNCEPIAEEYQKAYENILSKREADFTFKKELAKELAEIKKNNGRISNFIMSGHDGGGSFGGYKGTLSRSEIAQVMNEFQDINDVSTLMLLGCYTGVQNEIVHWKGIFPKVKMIGGYDGSAPLSDKPMGHYYLEDLLVKEKKLLQQADEKKINDYVKANIRGLSSMNTAVYVEPACSEDQELAMYYGSTTTKKFSKFDLSQCAKSAGILNQITLKFSNFDSGEVEPPKDPSDPSIKTVYDQARSLEHCIQQLEIPLDVNALFNLRFYDAVKTNFANFYKNEVDQVAAILKSDQSSLEFLEKDIEDQIANIEEYAKKIVTDNEKLAKDPEGYFRDLKMRVEQDNRELNAMLSEKRDILNKLHDPSYNASFEETQLFNRYNELKQRIAEDSMAFFYQTDPGQLATINSYKVSQRVAELNMSKENIKKLKQNEIWLPTAENLKNKSRKELRDNLFRIDSVLTINSLPRKTRLALEWIKNAENMHLIHFQNPFSWHEVTAQVESPVYWVPVAQSIYVPQTGMGGLFAPGSMGGLGGGFGGSLGVGPLGGLGL